MAVDLSTLGDHADAAFQTFGQSLAGAGVDVGREWSQILGHKAALSFAADTAETAINDLLDGEAARFMPADQKAYRVQQARQAYEAAEKKAHAAMTTDLAVLRATLDAASQSDLKTGDAAERALIRQEIDMHLAAVPKGGTVTLALYGLMKDARYTAEIASGYGALLLQRAGEESRNLMRDLLASVPGTTPKAKAARAALKALDGTVGHVTGLVYSNRARVETAAKPRPVTGYQPDTFRPGMYK